MPQSVRARGPEAGGRPVDLRQRHKAGETPTLSAPRAQEQGTLARTVGIATAGLPSLRSSARSRPSLSGRRAVIQLLIALTGDPQ